MLFFLFQQHLHVCLLRVPATHPRVSRSAHTHTPHIHTHTHNTHTLHAYARAHITIHPSLTPETPYAELVSALLPHFVAELADVEDERADAVLDAVAAALGCGDAETVADWVARHALKLKLRSLAEVDPDLPAADVAASAELLFAHLHGDGGGVGAGGGGGGGGVALPWDDVAFVTRVYDAAL
jgi:hypothetical protein